MRQNLVTKSTSVKVNIHVLISLSRKIPCKHMFAVFNHFSTWEWCHLPASLTKAPHMTLDETTYSTAVRGVTTDDNDAHSAVRGVTTDDNDAHSAVRGVTTDDNDAHSVVRGVTTDDNDASEGLQQMTVMHTHTQTQTRYSVLHQ